MRRLLLPALLLAVAAGLHAQARRPPLPREAVSAVSDGKAVRGVEVVQVEGAPCLSLRDVRRLTGGRLVWRRMAREVSHEYRGGSVLYSLDSSTAAVNGKSVFLESPVRWWTGQAYVPVSFFLSPDFGSFAGAQVDWSPSAKILAFTPLPAVSSPRFTAKPGRTRVVFDVGPRVDYRVLSDRDGGLWLRLFGGRSGDRERLQVQDPLITSVDILPRNNATDILFTFGSGATPPVVTMEDAPRRLVVEVLARSAGTAPSSEETDPLSDAEEEDLDVEAPEVLPIPLPPVVPVAAPAEIPSTEEKKLLQSMSPVRVIVIDPGHGGKDAGATGRRGTLEKDVNLDISLRLADALRKTGRYHVFLTREDDRFMSLQGRAEFANEKKADLFISIHCNAALSSRASGFEVYFLSENASDDSAAATARRENASIELEGAASQAKAKVSQLLWALAKTEALNDSSEMAALVNKEAVKKSLEAENRGVKQAGFYVLKWANMPAVLVESAFITNPREEKLLRSRRYQDKIVSILTAGVRVYEERKIQARLAPRKEGGS